MINDKIISLVLTIINISRAYNLHFWERKIINMINLPHTTRITSSYYRKSSFLQKIPNLRKTPCRQQTDIHQVKMDKNKPYQYIVGRYSFFRVLPAQWG